MGRTAIIIVFVLLVVVGGIFVSLTQRQTKALDSIIQSNYSKQARHLANTYAHTMVGRLRNEISKGSSNQDILNLNIKMPASNNENYTIILDIPQASVSANITEKYKDEYTLETGEYAITSIGRVKSPEGQIYEAITYIVYTTGGGTEFEGHKTGDYIRILNEGIETTSSPGGSPAENHKDKFPDHYHPSITSAKNETVNYNTATSFYHPASMAIGSSGKHGRGKKQAYELNNLNSEVFFFATQDMFVMSEIISSNPKGLNKINLYSGGNFYLKEAIHNDGFKNWQSGVDQGNFINIYVGGDLVIDSSIHNTGIMNIYIGGNIINKGSIHNNGTLNIYSQNNINPGTVLGSISTNNIDNMPEELTVLKESFNSSGTGNPRIKVWEEKPITVSKS